MPRPALRPGEWGNLHFTTLDDGRTRVDARCRDLDGRRRRLRVIGRHETACIARLEEESGLRVPKRHVVLSDRPDMLERSSTLNELLGCWLQLERDAGSVNSATAASLQGHIRNHIAESIGTRRLDELTTFLIERHLLLARKRLSATVVRRTRSILIRALEMAHVYRLIDENMAALTRRVRVPESRPRALSLEEVAMLRSRLERWATVESRCSSPDSRQLRAIINVALGTGLRVGEILGLRQSAVDLEARTLSVEATVSWSPEHGIQVTDALKRARQRRLLPLPNFAVAALRDAITSRPIGAELVFSDNQGRPIRPNAARATLRRFAEETGIAEALESVEPEDFSFKLLRSTVATHLARKQRLELVRDQLGHAAVATTVRSYVVPTATVDPRNASVLQELFGPGSAWSAASDPA